MFTFPLGTSTLQDALQCKLVALIRQSSFEDAIALIDANGSLRSVAKNRTIRIPPPPLVVCETAPPPPGPPLQ